VVPDLVVAERGVEALEEELAEEVQALGELED
jgi:hypothetical protein